MASETSNSELTAADVMLKSSRQRTLKSHRVARLAVLLASTITLFFLYFTNSNVDREPDARRGDGTYRPVEARGDGHLLFLMTRSLALDGDIDYSNDLKRFGDPWSQPRSKSGRKQIPHPIGPSLVHTVSFGVAHFLSKIANVTGSEIPGHGYTAFHQRITFLLSPLFLVLTGMLGWFSARVLLGSGQSSLYGAMAMVFGTSLLYYGTYMPSYAHAMDAFASGLFVAYWLVSQGRWDIRRFLVLGVLLGFAALIRVTGFAWGGLVLVEICATLLTLPWRNPRAAFRKACVFLSRGLIVVVIAIIVFSPQLYYWKTTWGDWLVSPMGPRFVRLGYPHILEVLFSSRNGWLSTHPIAYAGVVGLFFLPKRARVGSIGLLLVISMMVWINASVEDWWSGASFGNRRFCSLSVPIAIGVASLCYQCARIFRPLPRSAMHIIALVVFGWFVAWNMSASWKLRGGKGANAGRRECCGFVSKSLARIASPVYRQVGNPFAFPANALFAWRHGGDWKRWDVAVGHWFDRPRLKDHNSGAYRGKENIINLPGVGYAPWINSGLGPHQAHNKTYYRWTTESVASALIPLWMPDARHIKMEVEANLGAGSMSQPFGVAFNGKRVFDGQLRGGLETVQFDLAEEDINVGMNTIVFFSEPRSHEGIDLKRPAGPERVGVAIHKLRARF